MILLPSPCNPVVDHNYFIQYNTLHDDTKGNSIGDQIPNSQTPLSSQSGEMVSQSEPWMREYNEALKLVDEISTMVSDASFLSSIGPQTQRHFASTRRKIAILRSKLETLELLMSQIPANRQPITQKETNKRKDMLASISSKVEQMANTLNPYSAARRDRLLDQDTRSDDMMKVADMDNHDVVAFQRQIIKDIVQDEELGKLKEEVVSTKHIALAINEELHLHTRLLDSLDYHVDSTGSQLQRRLAAIFNKHTKGGCSCLFLAVLSVVVLILVVLALIKYL